MSKQYKGRSLGPEAGGHIRVGDLLKPIIAFLRRSGIPTAELVMEFQTALKKATQSRSKLKVVHIVIDQEVINIVNRWLRDPAYLNRVGRPDDLPLVGTRSIKSLIKACRAHVEPRKALKQLLEFRVVKHVTPGKYRLIRRLMVFEQKEYLAFEPHFRFLVDAIKAGTSRLTYAKNTSGLFWQCADNYSIQTRYRKAFLRFAHQRGLSFMHELNDWLDEHETRNLSRRGSVGRVGVGLFGISSSP
jgi:hypothetical protein